jgi:GNAT superfamily N-acetyltransferase
MPANPLLNGLLNVPDQGLGAAPTNGLAPPNLLLPPDSGAPTQAQGIAQTGSALWQAVQALQWPSVADQKAMLQPLPGWQGQAVDAARQYANALMMGTTAPGAAKGIDGVRQAWDALGVDHAVSEGNGTITLSKIVVPQDVRNQGVGSQALQQLTDYADATGQRIVLSPSKDFGATSMSRLTDFYKSAGFRPNKGRSRDFTTMESMIRDPAGAE